MSDGGLGLEATRGESVVAIYGASVYLFSIAGGWIADRLLGANHTLLLGSFIIISGHIALAVPWAPASWIGIVLVAVGSGIFKPNPSMLVGALYSTEDKRRAAGFSIFYMSINIGSLTAPWVVSFLRNTWGFHAGFSAAAVGMAFAIIAFVWGRSLLAKEGTTPSNPMVDADDRRRSWAKVGYVLLGVGVLYAMFRSKQVTKREKHRLQAFVPLFIAAMLFFMIFEQAASTVTSFAAHRTRLSLGGIALNPEWFQSINPFSIVVLAPVFAWLWTRTDKKILVGHKFTVGLVLAGASFLIMMLASMVAGDGKASPLWLFVVYLVQTLGELCVSPVGLSVTSLLAPRAFLSQAMALWQLANAAGQSITAQTIQAMEGTSDTVYFGVLDGVALVFAVVHACLNPWIHRHTNAPEDEPELATTP